MSLLSDLPISHTPVIDELAKALKLLRWCRKHNNKTDDAIEFLESAAVDVVDLYKPGELDG